MLGDPVAGRMPGAALACSSNAARPVSLLRAVSAPRSYLIVSMRMTTPCPGAGHSVFGQDGSTEYSQTQSLTTDAVTIPNPEDLAATNTIDQIVRAPSSSPATLRTFCMLHVVQAWALSSVSERWQMSCMQQRQGGSKAAFFCAGVRGRGNLMLQARTVFRV